MVLETEGIVDVVGDEEEIVAETGESVVVPKGLPSPSLPSKAEVEHHNLTHLPYRSWCPFCVAARRKNNAHFANRGEGRAKPLFCADYCFVGETEDDENLSVLVGRVYQSTAMLAVPSEQKGHDEYAISRTAAFMKAEGLADLVYKSDQERAVRRLLGDVVTLAVKNGDTFSAVPEASAVGESQSNGRAEAAVQQFEDQLRTLKAALQARIGQKLPVTHPVVLWLVEHVASLINRHFVGSSGKTAYEYTHTREEIQGTYSRVWREDLVPCPEEAEE